MQKKFNFVRITKTGFALSCTFVLLLLVAASSRLKPTAWDERNAMPDVKVSMYKQLEDIVLKEDNEPVEITKMNNLAFENSNTIPSDSKIQSIETVKVLIADTGVIETMDLEYYTLCSVVAEMPQSFHAEALKAQAVACRTFAFKSALSGNKHKNVDICSDYRCCQSFKDIEKVDFDISKARDAVRATEGIIAVYDGEPILAAYHSSSVGYTKSSEAVWGGRVEYLVPVAAAENKESASKESVFTKDKLIKALKKYGATEAPEFFHGNDGMCVGASSGNVNITPKQIKNALNLRSSTFDVKISGDSYIFKTYGYGHGVGMSQYGADALGGKGFNFYEILKYYYTGISFEFLN